MNLVGLDLPEENRVEQISIDQQRAGTNPD